MSLQVLVLNASKHGHTARIAERIGGVLEEQGISASVRSLRDAREALPSDFDGVVAGGSVHGSHHEHELLEWLAEHHTSLSCRPSAFFSVSLTAAEDTDEARAVTQDLIDDVLDATGWIPTMTSAFAGALQFREYDFPTRVLMRLIARQHGHEVDPSRDVDYTDWEAVERFARKFAQRLERHVSERAATGTPGVAGE